jgi:hypothetical protein
VSPGPSAGPRILRAAAQGLAVTAVTLLAAAALLEIGFRLFAPQPTALNVSRWDPEYGWRNEPGARGFFRTSEFRMEVRIDSLGLRDDETTWAKPPGTYRILGLGDSFAFGHGVAAESCFLSIAERRLDQRSRGRGGPRVEVLDAGVGKWSTAAEYLYFRREGVRFSPDAAVLAFCVDNDFEDNAGQSLLRLEGGRLERVENPEPVVRKAQSFTRLVPGYRFLAERSHLVNFIRIRASRLDANLAAARMKRAGERSGGSGQGEPAWLGLRLPITRMLLDSLAAEAGRAHARLLVLFVPGRWQCAPASERVPGKFSDPGLHAALVDTLVAHLDSLGVPVVYPLAALREAGRSRRLYFDEGHLNEAGSRIVGDALFDGLVAAGIAPPVPQARAGASR